ncbi:uncharacterized protein SCHCODRAFT_02632487 [Schizophyllum commune H4-8]|uniref:uncharacterized protein n=1 Tax=Schizophyllum commune (strain H4-8 / FGSC 9210) TaxID=578458 RepID=UPI00215E7D28|nr:uncharacterized protein SCHCODRAFT_02632487 [Schizophyllum commune H4-8]KAI5890651.1 hypothetical protein SCHCODRAFT_02632487 [Schizophyllum commune H4-8]
MPAATDALLGAPPHRLQTGLELPHFVSPWHAHLVTQNPYPPPPPPPPVAHKVWLIDCRTCGTFLTNRGMKAVLLLRPNVSLYSSDALPVNCSATSTPSTTRPPTNTRAQQQRTCECLTQSLCCHGCGNTVGYMIVIPCSRCTSSITANNRATNGHRFVFHSMEVVGSERHYVQGEPGVVPYDPIPVHLTMPVHPFIPQPVSVAIAQRNQMPGNHPFPPRPYVIPAESLPTPPLETEDDFSPPSSASQSPVHHSPTEPLHDSSSLRSPPPPAPDTPPPLVDAYTLEPFVEHKELPPRRQLKPGDIVHWHHLARHGEIPAVMDDERARRSDSASDAEDQVFGMVVCGR